MGAKPKPARVISSPEPRVPARPKAPKSAHSRIGERSFSETRYRRLFERNLAGVFMSQNGVLLDCNDSFAQIFGFESRQHILANFQKFDPQGLIDRIKQSDVWVEPMPSPAPSPRAP